LPFADVPLFIEAAGPGTREMLSRVAVKLSTKVHWLASSKRAHLHLAAVFACNYINYMYTQAGTILQNAGQDFGILAPLIRETAEKAIDHGPANSQTGPAIREDKATLGKHSQMLSGHPDIKKLYIELAEMIMKSKPGKNKKT
jgi:predicted short-subunit dehydrogenase-like oxidoreductase (DUF2520 family)